MLSGFQPYLIEYGEPALFVSVFIEAAGAPAPGETAIVAAFLLAVTTHASLLTVGLIAWVAAVLGDNLGYAAGRYIGRDVLLRHGRPIGITEDRLTQTERALEAYGPFLVAGARFFPILRQIAGIGSGVIKMPWPLFIAGNLVGALMWVGLWGSLAYFFSDWLQRALANWHGLTGGLPILLLTWGLVPFLVVYFVRRFMLQSDKRGDGV